MIIPPEKLTEEVLKSIIESYVTRDGTDYGEEEASLEQKVAQLLPQVVSGEVVIVYDEASESVNLLPKDQVVQGQESE